MKKFFLPLIIFLGGNLALLIGFIAFPALGDAETTLRTETAAWNTIGWGWTWITGAGTARILTFLVFEAAILWGTGKAFLHQIKS